jgi:nucleoside-diphosphate-sugar epimerase
MKEASLIGHTGFVGKNLLDLKYFNFTKFFNSKNIYEIANYEHDLVVCAAPNAEKWKANKYPKQDLQQVLCLIENLENIKTKEFILFSTIDVYSSFPCDESVTPDIYNTSIYGKNRILLENYVLNYFPKCKILRLPGLFGKHLKKNLIFDLMNNNVSYDININNRMQWFPIDFLNEILDFVIASENKIFNISVEPISNEELLGLFKTKEVNIIKEPHKINYNMKTIQKESGYFYTKNEIFKKINAFISI